MVTTTRRRGPSSQLTSSSPSIHSTPSKPKKTTCIESQNLKINPFTTFKEDIENYHLSSPPCKIRRTSSRLNSSPSKSLVKSISYPCKLSIDKIDSKRLQLENIETNIIALQTEGHPHVSDTTATLIDLEATPKPKQAVDTIVSIPFPNVFSHARHLLRLSSVSDLGKDEVVGRSQEVEKLHRFLTNRYPSLFDDDNYNPEGGKSLYISGPPGTGKTHLINSILLNPNHRVHQTLTSSGIRVHFINCMAMGNPLGSSGSVIDSSISSGSNSLDDQLWRKIAACVGLKEKCFKSPSKTSKKSSIKDLVKNFILSEQSQPCLIILDEIDHLATSKQPLITSLLTLSQLAPNSNFTVIGIANTLDLTTRFTWSLESTEDEVRQHRPEPDLIHFSPFDANDMIQVVKQRLQHLLPSYSKIGSSVSIWGSSPAQKLFSHGLASETIPLFQSTALTLCAKRVSNVTGDLRTFLAILRKLIDTLESRAIENIDFIKPTSKDNDPASNNSVLDTPTKMRKFSRIISTSQLLPDLKNSQLQTNESFTDPTSHFTPLTAPKITATELIKYLNQSKILNQSSTSNKSCSEQECKTKLNELNLHQSLGLVCLCVAWSRHQANGGDGGVGKKKAFAIYRELMQGLKIAEVSECEWQDVIESGLQTRGLVNVSSSSSLNSFLSPSSSIRSTTSTPSKNKFSRSMGFSSPSKSKLSNVLSPQKTPRKKKTNENVETDEVTLSPVYGLSILIKSFKSLERESKVIDEILKEVIMNEERLIKKKRKWQSDERNEKEFIGRVGKRIGKDENEAEEEEEEVVRNRIVGVNDEGSVRD
ncbi:cell division cycle protein [Melampsora americana]|nr:cell division cycle protein [Melampsora americana]